MDRTPRVWSLVLVAASAILSATGCATNRPTEVASRLVEDEDVVFVKTIALPETSIWFIRFARHTWIDYRSDGTWYRINIPTKLSGIRNSKISRPMALEDARGERDIRVLSAFAGERATRIIAHLREVEEQPFDYRPWPGPNSNTFVETVVRETPELHAKLWGTAVGKDYAWPVRAGWTAAGTGVELDTPIFGLMVGWREGIELDLLNVLTFGVGFWPPSITLPFLPPIGPRFEVPVERE